MPKEKTEITFRTIGRYSEEDSAYILYAPELPGCAADGPTIEKARTNMRVSIKEWLGFEEEVRSEPPCDFTQGEWDAADVAHCILDLAGPMATAKLQALVYYCQVWSLAWYGEPLFWNRIDAGLEGPVCVDLAKLHRRTRETSASVFPSTRELAGSGRRVVNAVMDVYGYGSFTAEELNEMVRSEAPWCEAMSGAPKGERLGAEITHESIIAFYEPLSRIAVKI